MHTVLIVDDSVTARRVVRRELELPNHHVAKACMKAHGRVLGATGSLVAPFEPQRMGAVITPALTSRARGTRP